MRSNIHTIRKRKTYISNKYKLPVMKYLVIGDEVEYDEQGQLLYNYKINEYLDLINLYNRQRKPLLKKKITFNNTHVSEVD